jgi:hypothetical protein
MKMKIHQVIYKDKDGQPFSEARYCNGILYRQNRSHDVSICFNDFLDRLNNAKESIKKDLFGNTIEYTILENDQKWVSLTSKY